MKNNLFAGNNVAQKNHSAINKNGIKFLLFLTVFLVIFCWLYNKITSKYMDYMWLPIILWVVASFPLGASLGKISFLEKHFLVGEQSVLGTSYSFYVNPVGKYKEEVTEELMNRFVAKDYRKNGRKRIGLFLLIGFIICLIACFIDYSAIIATILYPLNAVFAYWLYRPSTITYLDTSLKTNPRNQTWRDCLCPNCGAYIAPNDMERNYTDSNVSYSLGKVNVKDTYTYKGENFYGSHDELTIDRTTKYSWQDTYPCSRCNKRTVKNDSSSYTKTIY